jgi:hypothetical protein
MVVRSYPKGPIWRTAATSQIIERAANILGYISASGYITALDKQPNEVRTRIMGLIAK